jgi:hypothetical protein
MEVLRNGFHASNDVTTDAYGLGGRHVTQIVDPATTTQRRHQGPSSSPFLSSRTDISVVPIPSRVHGGVDERVPCFERLQNRCLWRRRESCHPNATTMRRSRHHHPTEASRAVISVPTTTQPQHVASEGGMSLPTTSQPKPVSSEGDMSPRAKSSIPPTP